MQACRNALDVAYVRPDGLFTVHMAAKCHTLRAGTPGMHTTSSCSCIDDSLDAVHHPWLSVLYSEAASVGSFQEGTKLAQL